MVWLSIALILLWSPLLYLWMLGPGRPRIKEMRPFEKVYIAHRGLHDISKGIPENSLTAFQRAAQAGYGMEMDLQLTRDGKLVVFHDATLERMCGVNKKLTDLTYEELQKFPLMETKERIPLFEDVLKVVGGRTPLIVEMKAEGKCFRATKMACEMLSNYQGLYCMESFHPLCMWWVRRHYPKILRGQLSMNYFIEEAGRPFYQKLVMTSMILNVFSRPDFIAYKHSQREQFSYHLLRKLYRVENVAWTIRSQEELEQARPTFRVMIFENFIPRTETQSR